jgi:formate/nitrite transporter FocA (FNT family)
MIGYAVGAALYPLIVGSSVITWVTALVFAGALILYLIATSRLFANQIEVSTHPLGEKKMMISLLLAILVSVSVAVGYISDSTARSYVIPPEGKTAISKYMVNTVQSLIDGQKATAKQKEDAIKEAQKAADDTVNKIEEQLKPAQKYVPVMLGAIVFSLAQIVLIFVVIIAALLVPLLFLILKAARFIHTVTEKCQVVRWTLE